MDFLLSVSIMMFDANFNNISFIVWQSVLLVEESGVPGENHWVMKGNVSIYENEGLSNLTYRHTCIYIVYIHDFKYQW